MKRAALLVVALATLAAACSNGDPGDAETANSIPPPADMPLCSDLFQDQKVIEEASFGLACRTAADEIEVPLFVKLVCHDNRKLVWNDFAWGYVTEPMTLWTAEDSVRMPTDEALSCRQGVTTTTAAPADT